MQKNDVFSFFSPKSDVLCRFCRVHKHRKSEKIKNHTETIFLREISKKVQPTRQLNHQSSSITKEAQKTGELYSGVLRTAS